MFQFNSEDGDEMPTNTVKLLRDADLLLPPSQIEKSLNTFKEAGLQGRRDFEELLRTPFLQDIKIPVPADAEARTGSAHLKSVAASNGSVKTLYPLLSEGMSNFLAVQVFDVGVARNLAAYAGLIPVLIQSLPRAELASSLSAMVSKYVTQANAKAINVREFFTEFNDSVHHMSSTTLALSQDLAEIREEISNVEEQISEEGKPFARRMADRLHKYLASTNGTTDSVLVTLALILNISIQELKRTFDNPEDPDAKNELLDHLQAFEERLAKVRESLSSLQCHLKNFLQASTALMSVWHDIAMKIPSLTSSEEGEEPFSVEDQSIITEEWGKLRAEALSFISQVGTGTSSSIATASSISQDLVSSSVRSIRIVSRDLSIVSQQKVNPLTDIQQRALDNLSLDPELVKKIEMMSRNSGSIVASFNKILQIPFLSSLKVTTVAEDESKSEEVDLQVLTTRYLQQYQELQANTVPFARTLTGYAGLQQTLIPELGKGLSITDYVNANESIIHKYRDQAQQTYSDHLRFKEKWNQAINAVKRAINEQKENIKSIEKRLDELRAEKKKYTILGALAIVGAVLFTPLAFLTGGLLAVVVIGAGIAAGKLLDKADQLGETIRVYELALDSANKTVDNLRIVLPIMVEVLNLLREVTNIWSTITQQLVDLGTDITQWNLLKDTPAMPALLEKAKNSWTAVRAALLEYINVVSDSNPEASKV